MLVLKKSYNSLQLTNLVLYLLFASLIALNSLICADMPLRLHSKSRSDRLLQLKRLVGGANLDHKYRFQ